MKKRLVESFEDFLKNRNLLLTENHIEDEEEYEDGGSVQWLETEDAEFKYIQYLNVFLSLPQNRNLLSDPSIQAYINGIAEVSDYKNIFDLLNGWESFKSMDITSKYGSYKNIKILADNPLLKTKEIQTLFSFIDFPMSNTDDVIEKFKTLNGAIFREGGNPKERFVYVEGTRPDKVLLVAHADTIFDYYHIGGYNVDSTHQPIFDGELLKSTGLHSIGSDDRCGVAMCWLLKDSGHSILIVDGEEPGDLGSVLGSQFIRNKNKDIYNTLNDNHKFMVQFDRMGFGQYKTYDVGTVEFDKYIEQTLGLYKPNNLYYTDICILSRPDGVCGVNLSVGYYGEHTEGEYTNIQEWYESFKKYEQWLLGSTFERFGR